MFSLQDHIKAGKPTVDLAGNQTLLANLRSGKFHQAENHFIVWAQIPQFELREEEHPPGRKALPKPQAALGSPPPGEPCPEHAWLEWEISEPLNKPGRWSLSAYQWQGTCECLCRATPPLSGTEKWKCGFHLPERHCRNSSWVFGKSNQRVSLLDAKSVFCKKNEVKMPWAPPPPAHIALQEIPAFRAHRETDLAGRRLHSIWRNTDFLGHRYGTEDWGGGCHAAEGIWQRAPKTHWGIAPISPDVTMFRSTSLAIPWAPWRLSPWLSSLYPKHLALYLVYSRHWNALSEWMNEWGSLWVMKTNQWFLSCRGDTILLMF